MKQRRHVPLIAALAFSGALLTACGGDDDPAAAASSPSGNSPPASNPPSSNPPASNPPPSSGNSAPVITGTPLTSVLQGSAYVFAPGATDPDGNALTFSVANLPPWAAFNSSTGRLTGTPTAANVGTYNNITVSVSDGSATASLAAFSIQVVGTATGSATLNWSPPTQNTDGSPLSNLAGYKVYWGTQQGNYTNSATIANPGIATYVVDQLTPARWYFAVTAYSSGGVESGYSNVASKTVQ
jgi:Putative Ig domain